MKYLLGWIVCIGCLWASVGWSQEVSRPPVGPPAGNRLNRPAGPPPPAPSPATQQSRYQQLFDQANELAAKINRSGPWEKHARDMQQMIEERFAASGMNSETEQFFKRVIIETQKAPPWDFNARMKVGTDLIRERYGLNDEQVKKAQSLFIRSQFQLFMKYGEQIMPVVKEAVETRLANKPFTPEQVARWVKVVRPIMERQYGEDLVMVGKFAAENLTAEQRQKLDKDLEVVDHHAQNLHRDMKEWEQGKWTPEAWGMQKDAIQMAGHPEGGGPSAAGGAATRSADGFSARGQAPNAPQTPGGPNPTATGDRPNRFRSGPMRIGDQPGSVGAPSQEKRSSLPDENQWVAYVNQFIAKYGLDESQKSSAMAILKDLQEQAQGYRSARKEQIEKFESQIRSSTDGNERASAQAGLGELLSGIDGLFEDLKKRLSSIPTADQVQKAGS